MASPPFAQLLAQGHDHREQPLEIDVCSTPSNGHSEAHAGLPVLNIPLEIGRGNIRIFWSGLDPVGKLLGEHLEYDAADLTAEGADGLVVSLSLGAFFLVVALRLRNPFTMVIDGRHHRRLGAGVDMLRCL